MVIESAAITSINIPSELTQITESDSCLSGSSLASYASCTIHFGLQRGSSGNENIVVNYNTGSLSQMVTWYNGGVPTALLQMSANPSFLNFDLGVGQSTTVTVTNIGGYDLESINVPAPVSDSGNASAIIESSTCTGNLAVGDSCTYIAFINSSAVESASINLGIEGYYNESIYSRVLTVSYMVEKEPSRFFYSTSQNGSDSFVFMYKIDESTGQLIQNGAAIDTGNAIAGGIAVDPSGSYAYVTNVAGSGRGKVVKFSINESGVLTLSENITTADSPRALKIDPTGKFLYLTHTNSISAYNIESDGSLTLNSTYTPVSSSLVDMVIDPSGRFAYLTNNSAGTSSNILAYKIESDGALSSISSTPDIPDMYLYGIAIDPSGRFVYVADYSVSNLVESVVSSYRIESNGTLALIGAVPCPGGPLGVAVDPAGKFVYVSTDTAIETYKIQMDGTLAAYSYNLSGALAWVILTDSLGKNVYAASLYNSSLLMFQITNGNLTLEQTISVSAPNGIAIH